MSPEPLAFNPPSSQSYEVMMKLHSSQVGTLQGLPSWLQVQKGSACSSTSQSVSSCKLDGPVIPRSYVHVLSSHNQLLLLLYCTVGLNVCTLTYYKRIAVLQSKRITYLRISGLTLCYYKQYSTGCYRIVLATKKGRKVESMCSLKLVQIVVT